MRRKMGGKKKKEDTGSLGKSFGGPGKITGNTQPFCEGSLILPTRGVKEKKPL